MPARPSRRPEAVSEAAVACARARLDTGGGFSQVSCLQTHHVISRVVLPLGFATTYRIALATLKD